MLAWARPDVRRRERLQAAFLDGDRLTRPAGMRPGQEAIAGMWEPRSSNSVFFSLNGQASGLSPCQPRATSRCALRA